MIYVLIGIALFGFLTVTMSRQNNQADGEDTDSETVALYANELIQYSASAQAVVEMMLSTGSEMNDLNFVIPTSGAYNTPPHGHKIFHPAGGGMNYQATFSSDIEDPTSGAPGWYVRSDSNVEWTESTLHDGLLSALGIKISVCRQLNKIITGSNTIPQLSGTLADFFQSGGSDFDIANCAACEGYPNLCVENAAGNEYGFYSIIAAQ